MILLLLLSCTHCEPAQLGAIGMGCAPVEACTRGGDTWYEARDGTRYDCQSAASCGELLCDQCDLSADMAAYLCPGA